MSINERKLNSKRNLISLGICLEQRIISLIQVIRGIHIQMNEL